MKHWIGFGLFYGWRGRSWWNVWGSTWNTGLGLHDLRNIWCLSCEWKFSTEGLAYGEFVFVFMFMIVGFWWWWHGQNPRGGCVSSFCMQSWEGQVFGCYKRMHHPWVRHFKAGPNRESCSGQKLKCRVWFYVWGVLRVSGSVWGIWIWSRRLECSGCWWFGWGVGWRLCGVRACNGGRRWIAGLGVMVGGVRVGLWLGRWTGIGMGGVTCGIWEAIFEVQSQIVVFYDWLFRFVRFVRLFGIDRGIYLWKLVCFGG